MVVIVVISDLLVFGGRGLEPEDSDFDCFNCTVTVSSAGVLTLSSWLKVPSRLKESEVTVVGITCKPIG